jgi:hypothetical protein
MAWSYDDLTRYPLAAFKTPATAWDVRLVPQVDGRPLAQGPALDLEPQAG